MAEEQEKYYELGKGHGELDRLASNEHGHSVPIHILLPEYKDEYWRGYNETFNLEVDDGA